MGTHLLEKEQTRSNLVTLDTIITETRRGAEEARLAHNQQVTGSKPVVAIMSYFARVV